MVSIKIVLIIINRNMILRIGTDCSGIEAPIQALNKLKIKYKHIWSCEIDKHAQKSIKANYNPNLLFDDITKKRTLPDIDLYVCGFPCQAFSMAGKRKGFNDKRGIIFFNCLDVIRKKQPNVFILENVKGLLSHDNGNTWDTIKKHLSKLKLYNIYHKVLNTKDYGIPQNRERIFIIGIKKTIQKKEFLFPKPTKLKNIHNYIDLKDTQIKIPPNCCKNSLQKSKSVFVDLSFVNIVSSTSYMNYSPTLTSAGNLWCVPQKRHANIKEYLKLQGFPVSFKQVVSDTQMKKQIGNSMSVNVLVYLFKSIFDIM